MIIEGDLQKAAKAIGEAGSIVIACHVSPDGDALGSMLGLGMFLERQSKRVWMSWGSPEIAVPPQYRFLPGIGKVVPPDQVPDDADCFVAIDCADVGRLEVLQGKFHSSRARLNIDHHVSNPGYGDINLVDPAAGSSCELAFALVKALGGTPTREEATCIYTGIVTDTGRFQYSNTSPETLRAAAELRQTGLDHVRVAEEIYESASFTYLHVLGLVLARAKLEDGVVYSWVMQDDLAGLGLDETEHFIDVLRSVQEAKVAALIKQQPEGGFKVSLRSRAEVDVSLVARSFGGGGHARAAGFSTEGPVERVVDELRSLVRG